MPQEKWKSQHKEAAYRFLAESSALHFRVKEVHGISPVTVQQIDMAESKDCRLFSGKTRENSKTA